MQNMNELDGLYHRDLGFPAGIVDTICRAFALQVFHHARRALVDDRYLSAAVADGRQQHPGAFNAPDLIPALVMPRPDQIIEVEIARGRVEKFVIRLPATPNFDVVLALMPDGNEAVVKTLWLNQKTDTHKTLDVTKYRKP